MRTISILNMKGGVGKTTTAINLAYILATKYEQRVLLVDADGQANTTRMLLPDRDYPGLAAVLQGKDWDGDPIVETDISRLHVLPASSRLWAVDLSCITDDGRHVFSALYDMRSALEEVDAYDVMVVDCPPSFSAACIAAIRASDCIVIPALPDAFSAEGMADLMEQIDSARKFHPSIRVGGILVNQWHKADVVEDAVAYLRETSPVPVYRTVIRRTDKVLESTWAKEPVLVWSPRCAAARDYQAWVAELVREEGLCRG